MVLLGPILLVAMLVVVAIQVRTTKVEKKDIDMVIRSSPLNGYQ